MQTRKTRIVCISDTHNQTPKLPAGDVLIHAGDLTNQGSYSELQKTVAWLEKADFQAKIVVAGNHDTTLDECFFFSNENKWKWPTPQIPAACRKLLLQSPSLTYLEHEAATILLTAPNDPKTCFKIFGSPYSPGTRGWAFQYADAATAEILWSDIEEDSDIVVTHTPAHGHCDQTDRVEMAGCLALGHRLARTRPLLHVCGHIHDARGVERVRWKPRDASASSEEMGLGCVEAVTQWEDPGAGNKKLALLDLTARSRRGLDNVAHCQEYEVQRDLLVSAECPEYAGDKRGMWRKKIGGAIERRYGRAAERGLSTTAGCQSRIDEGHQQNETAFINAAILGVRKAGKAMALNKPIVVDVELPVWSHRGHPGI